MKKNKDWGIVKYGKGWVVTYLGRIISMGKTKKIALKIMADYIKKASVK